MQIPYACIVTELAAVLQSPFANNFLFLAVQIYLSDYITAGWNSISQLSVIALSFSYMAALE